MSTVIRCSIDRHPASGNITSLHQAIRGFNPAPLPAPVTGPGLRSRNQLCTPR
jgi:hypothetical protein